MNPLLDVGQRRVISDLDKQAMDVLGWDLQSGGTNLTTLHLLAQTQLAQRMGVTVEEMAANPNASALLLAPTWIDQDNNALDDRGERLSQMIVDSSVYEWGWSGYWWGWSGYWQEHGDLSQAGFWQNMSWQTVDMSITEAQMNGTQPADASVPEPSSILGLLGVGWLGLGSWRQRRGNRRNED